CLPDQVVNRETAFTQASERFAMRLPLCAFESACAVKDRAEAAPGDNGGIELLERSGRGIARVGKGDFTFSLSFFIDFGKLRLWEKDLSAYFQQLRAGGMAKPVRNGADRPDVLCHVVARYPVAA